MKRCLACGCIYDGDDEYPMCPQRYLSPHDEEHMGRVAEALDAMGLKNINRPSTKQHQMAIDIARLV